MLIISLKENDRVYILSESYDCETQKNNALKSNSPIFINELDDEDTIFVCSSEIRSAYIKQIDTLTKKDEYKGKLTKNYLMNSLAKRVKNYFKENNLANPKNKRDLKASLVIANQDKVFFLGSGGVIREVGKVDSFSYATSFVLASMEALKDLSPINRLLITAYIYNLGESGLNFPLRVVDTLNKKIEKYYLEDIAKLYDSYLKGELK